MNRRVESYTPRSEEEVDRFLEQWREKEAIQEFKRFLDRCGRDELLQVLEMAVDILGGFGKDQPRPLNPRTVRADLRWLLERPTTDESRAWLLHELTRRIYEGQRAE